MTSRPVQPLAFGAAEALRLRGRPCSSRSHVGPASLTELPVCVRSRDASRASYSRRSSSVRIAYVPRAVVRDDAGRDFVGGRREHPMGAMALRGSLPPPSRAWAPSGARCGGSRPPRRGRLGEDRARGARCTFSPARKRNVRAWPRACLTRSATRASRPGCFSAAPTGKPSRGCSSGPSGGSTSRARALEDALGRLPRGRAPHRRGSRRRPPEHPRARASRPSTGATRRRREAGALGGPLGPVARLPALAA